MEKQMRLAIINYYLRNEGIFAFSESL